MPDLLTPQALATGESSMDRCRADHHLSRPALARHPFQALSFPATTFG